MNESNETAVSRRRFLVESSAAALAAGIAAGSSNSSVFAQQDKNKPPVADTQKPIKLPQKNQFALEIDHFAECVLENKEPFSPGEEGLQDHRIMEKIYEAARTGKTVKLSADIRNAKIPRGAEPKS